MATLCVVLCCSCPQKILKDIGSRTEESHMMSVLVDFRQYLEYAMQYTYRHVGQ